MCHTQEKHLNHLLCVIGHTEKIFYDFGRTVLENEIPKMK